MDANIVPLFNLSRSTTTQFPFWFSKTLVQVESQSVDLYMPSHVPTSKELSAVTPKETLLAVVGMGRNLHSVLPASLL